jgi:hypothetical protein
MTEATPSCEDRLIPRRIMWDVPAPRKSEVDAMNLLSVYKFKFEDHLITRRIKRICDFPKIFVSEMIIIVGRNQKLAF